ncbi:MAG: ABC transporter permease [Dehalococcoidia bacterium]|nr:ABC transporter permease [Dehalococcoidia bacterium]
MQAFLIRRTLLIVPTLVGATLVIFLIMRVVPGDIAVILLQAGTEQKVDPVALASLRHDLGLDRPLTLQYLSWLAKTSRGDLGDSMRTGRPIKEEVIRRFPLTAQLAIMAVVVGFAAGLPLGIISALKQNTWADYLSRVTSISFLAFPAFWLGLIVLMVGVRLFDWTPPLGYNVLWEKPITNLQQLVFPSLILGSHLLAIVARMTRSSMLEVMREDYIRTARAKGLSEARVIVRHAMKNSMIPVITIVSLQAAALLGGAVVMETVFSIPGIGAYLIEAIKFRDYTVAQALVLVFVVNFIVIDTLVDISYGWFDPRISHV